MCVLRWWSRLAGTSWPSSSELWGAQSTQNVDNTYRRAASSCVSYVPGRSETGDFSEGFRYAPLIGRIVLRDAVRTCRKATASLSNFWTLRNAANPSPSVNYEQMTFVCLSRLAQLSALPSRALLDPAFHSNTARRSTTRTERLLRFTEPKK